MKIYIFYLTNLFANPISYNRVMNGLYKAPILILILLTMSCGNDSLKPDHKVKEMKLQQYSFRSFRDIIEYRGGLLNPDENKMLVASNENGTNDLYEMDLESLEMIPVVEDDHMTILPNSYFPEDNRIIFRAQRPTDLFFSCYVREKNGDIVSLFPEGTRSRFIRFTKNNKYFYLEANARDPKYMDIFRFDAKSLEKKLVYKNEKALFVNMLGPNGKWLVLLEFHTQSDNDIYLVNLEKPNELKHLSPHEGEAFYNAQTFDFEEKKIYYTTSENSDFTKLKSYDLNAGTHADERKEDGDILGYQLSPKGTYQIARYLNNGKIKLDIKYTQNQKQFKFTDGSLDDFNNVFFSPSENQLTLIKDQDNSPRSIFLYDVQRKSLRQVTSAIGYSIDESHLVSSDAVNFPARDGMQLHGFLFKPHQAKPNHKVPVLIWPFGGIGGQGRPQYAPQRQFLLNHGYALLILNARGSQGYGKAYVQSNDRRIHQEPISDMVDAKQYLKTFPWIDADKVGLIGANYSGYMVLNALEQYPDEFVAGVDMFGFVNWSRLITNLPPFYENIKELLYKEIGEPNKDEKLLKAMSPYFHSQKITTPLFILQGGQDILVLPQESKDIEDNLKKRGIPVQRLVFEKVGAGFIDPANEANGMDAVIAFLNTHLKKEDALNKVKE